MDENAIWEYNFPRIQGDSVTFRSLNTADSEKIARETQEYLARGGRIHSVGPKDNKAAKDPIKRYGRDHIEHEKRNFSVKAFK